MLYLEFPELLAIPFDHLLEGAARQNIDVLYVRNIDGWNGRVLFSAGIHVETRIHITGSVVPLLESKTVGSSNRINAQIKTVFSIEHLIRSVYTVSFSQRLPACRTLYHSAVVDIPSWRVENYEGALFRFQAERKVQTKFSLLRV